MPLSAGCLIGRLVFRDLLLDLGHSLLQIELLRFEIGDFILDLGLVSVRVGEIQLFLTMLLPHGVVLTSGQDLP